MDTSPIQHLTSDTVPLSIITVCRNEVSRIQRTVDSVRGQSDAGFEWIVVDGASTDGTVDLLRRHVPPISRLISEPDRGLYDAMNKGILAARGTYVLFLNAGDQLDGAEVVRAFIAQAFSGDLIIGNLRVLMPDGTEHHRKSGDAALDRDRLYWRSYPHPATFIRRSLFARFGLYDATFRISADWEFFARLVARHGITGFAWDHDVAIFTNDGISARPENRTLMLKEKRRIHKLHYPAPYRWRRELNEHWGDLIHTLRQRLGTSRSP
jgi:glycosyltransferase involved in cell wall biosynthesis